MEIMMFVVADPEIDGSEVDQEAVAEWDRVMAERGVLKRAMRLRPADEARTVRVRGGDEIVTDGPFTESKEWIAGYDVIECADFDRRDREGGERRGRERRGIRAPRVARGRQRPALGEGRRRHGCVPHDAERAHDTSGHGRRL